MIIQVPLTEINKNLNSLFIIWITLFDLTNQNKILLRIRNDGQHGNEILLMIKEKQEVSYGKMKKELREVGA